MGTIQNTMADPEEDVAFRQIAPVGHYIALRIGFAFPTIESNALPEGWVDYYTQHGLMMHDPVMRWVYGNTGAVRWSAIPGPDPKSVLKAAGRFGLRFGVATACADQEPEGYRSFATFVRADREFTDDEMALLQRRLWRLHVARMPPSNVTQAELEALRLVRDGYLMKEIANQLGVSEGAVKQRLKNARLKLGAKTGSQAVSKAISYGLI